MSAKTPAPLVSSATAKKPQTSRDEQGCHIVRPRLANIAMVLTADMRTKTRRRPMSPVPGAQNVGPRTKPMTLRESMR